jgi:hypothetical protein
MRLLRGVQLVLAVAVLLRAASLEINPPAPVCFTNYVGPGSPRGANCSLEYNATDEKAALATLFRDTNGALWLRSDGWTSVDDDWASSPDVCEWYGVECSGDHVVALSLGSNNLQGPVPWDRLWRLTALERLHLADNKLVRGVRDIPPGALPLLVALDLRHNRLSGPLPDLSHAPFLAHVDLVPSPTPPACHARVPAAVAAARGADAARGGRRAVWERVCGGVPPGAAPRRRCARSAALRTPSPSRARLDPAPAAARQ